MPSPKIMKVALTHFSKKLRKNSTEVESLLWNRLRARQLQGIKFRRQQPIENLIVDFVSFEKRIVIELDGGQHKMNREKDNKRDRSLAENGFTVLRFWDSELIENMEGVLEVIRKKCLQ